MKSSRALSRGRLVDLVTNRKTNLSIEKEAFLILFLCLQIWYYCQEWGKKLPFCLFVFLGFAISFLETLLCNVLLGYIFFPI